VSAEAANGTVVVNADNTLTYTPNADYFGQDTITYTISDGADTASASVVVTVNPLNDTPVALDDSVNVNATGLSVIDVLGNDMDVDGDSLTVTSATATNGAVTINADGTLNYAPDDNVSGLDTITYEVSDGNGGTSTATVTVNRAPEATNDLANTIEGTAVVIDVLGNDVEFDGQALTVSAASATNGLVAIEADGTLTYVPNAGYLGTDTITYTVNDGNGGTDTATVSVNVNPEGSNNAAPVALDDTATVDAGTDTTIANTYFDFSVGIVDTRLLSNDTDAEGDALLITEVNGQALVNGTITIAGSNGGLFTIAEDGTASFNAGNDFVALLDGETAVTEVTYTVSDGNGGTDTATIQVTVNGLNDAVISVDDNVSVDEDTAPLNLNVFDNDTALISGDTLTVASVNGDALLVGTNTAGSNGGLFTINADGTATFDANGEFDSLATGEVLVTSVTYTVQGTNGEQSSSTVSIEITGVNDAPDAGDDFATVDAGTNTTIANLFFDFSVGSVDNRLPSNDIDAESDTLTITHVNGQALVNGEITIAGSNGGTFNIESDGTASFDATTGFEALAQGETAITEVEYTVDDGNGGTATATVQVTVNGQNDAPNAADDSASVGEQDPITIDLLANDSDIDGQSLSISSIDTSSLSGLLTDNGDGTVTYDTNGQFDALNDGEESLDWFTYTVSDGQGGLDTATVQLTVLGSTANTPMAPASDPTPPADSGNDDVPPNDFM